MEDATLTWESRDDPLPAQASIVDDGLGRFNESAADFSSIRKTACLARDAAGLVVGGALSRRWGACCEIQQIWVHEDHRRRGIARHLIHLTEAHARSHGCTLIFLETFSFQAPDLYRKLGYEVACRFDGFPDDVSKFTFRKTLSP